MTLPTEKKIFVFSDIHGCALEFEKMLTELPLQDDSMLIFLGDYVDRGEDSKKVVDMVLDLQGRYHTVTLMGNHEQMLLHYLDEQKSAAAVSFVYNGGGATLASYGDQYGNYEIPLHHMEFFRSLHLYYEHDDYVFVHAGLPDVHLAELDSKQNEWDLLWIRDAFYKSAFNWGKLIIHGHTPVPKCMFSEKRINIDTGCVYGQLLTVLELPSKKIYEVKKINPPKHYYLKEVDSKRKAVRFDTIMPVSIEYEGKQLHFDTVNYSEFGMLICDLKMPHAVVFQNGQHVQGTLGVLGNDQAYFEGKVIRNCKKGWAHYYALEFSVTPFDTTEHYL